MSCLEIGAVLADGTQVEDSHCDSCAPADPNTCEACEEGWIRLEPTRDRGWVCGENVTTTTTPFANYTCTEENCPPCENRCLENFCIDHPETGSYYYPVTGKWCGSLTSPAQEEKNDKFYAVYYYPHCFVHNVFVSRVLFQICRY